MSNAFSEFGDDSTTSKANNEPTSRASSRAPSPNRGASKDDASTIAEGYSQASWLAERGVDKSRRIKLVKVAHMRYQHPDLKQITTFLKDFGLRVIKKTPTQRWFAGYGPDQYVYYCQEGPKKFLGGTFQVESYEELEKVANMTTATVLSGIEEMTDAPGGGHIVTIADPGGFPINFMYGQSPRPDQPELPEKLIINDEVDKPRQRKFQRFEPGPAAVHKLGHFGMCVSNFDAELDFYIKNFNFVPSDVLYVPLPTSTDGKPDRKEVAVFCHIDRGQELVDHHTLFFSTVPEKAHVHHCSFEIHDFDTQLMGHQWLAQKGYKSVWGVGRHILGSQIFDYWWDTTGNMVEHYADGDLVNEDTPLAYGPAANEGLSVWGPEVPHIFLQ